MDGASRRTPTGCAFRPRSESKPYGHLPNFVLPGKSISLVNPDFKELLLIFNAHNVEYLIVGAHALAAYGHVRATEDLGVWVKPSRKMRKRFSTRSQILVLRFAISLLMT